MSSNSLGGQEAGVTTNPDIMVKPSLALMPRCSKVVLNQCLTIMSEFFLGAAILFLCLTRDS